MSTVEKVSDVPEYEAGFTSSVGGLWPPEVSSFSRIRGFYNLEMICADKQLGYLLEAFHDMSSSLGSMIDGTSITRVQARAVFGLDYLKHCISKRGFLQDTFEAAIPMERGLWSDWPVLVYLGLNSPLRQADPQDLQQIRCNLSRARQEIQKCVTDIFSKSEINGYQIDILREPGDADIDQLSVLYQRFGWERQAVVEIVNNPANIIGVARSEADIVSAGIAEVAVIPFKDGAVLRMAEITEAATSPGHERRGLYTAVSAKLLQELARMSEARQIAGGSFDIVYGECNGLSMGVLCVSKQQGRKFAPLVSQNLGFPSKGILIQSVPIDGVPRRTLYNDLVPTYLTTPYLHTYYGRSSDESSREIIRGTREYQFGLSE